MVLLIMFGAIQFIQPARNKNGQASPTEIGRVYSVPVRVQAVLQNTCYDCHSNNTRYPWYSFIQPDAWWMASHIRKGKQDLNFSAFGSYSDRRQQSKLKSIANSITDGTMPLSSYTFLHRGLSEGEKEMLVNWAIKTADSLQVIK
ncbi:MAG TPA: heme-binding domain-containing protein [Chitinophagaceae bacterium]|nr:heme-binding domain-containing protein [Chitinophagaceae bacterium]